MDGLQWCWIRGKVLIDNPHSVCCLEQFRLDGDDVRGVVGEMECVLRVLERLQRFQSPGACRDEIDHKSRWGGSISQKKWGYDELVLTGSALGPESSAAVLSGRVGGFTIAAVVVR